MRRTRGKSGVFGGICITLVVVLLVGGLGYVTNGFRQWDPKQWFEPDSETNEPAPDVTDENGVAMTGGEVYPFPSSMRFTTTSAMSASASEGVTVQATVLPENAENKEVDWSISWSNPDSEYAAGKTVTEYVTLTPQSDGSTTATVKCLQVFSETIIITVTTRDGRFTASCMVEFAGKPSSMTVDLSSVQVSNNIYLLGSNKTYEFPITLTNEWGQVGGSYCDFSPGVTNIGKIVVADRTESMYSQTWGEERILAINDIVSKFVTVSTRSDGFLIIETHGVIDSYYRQRDSAGGSGAIFRDKFKRWSSSCTVVK